MNQYMIRYVNWKEKEMEYSINETQVVFVYGKMGKIKNKNGNSLQKLTNEAK